MTPSPIPAVTSSRRIPGKRSVFLRILFFFCIPLVILAIASLIAYGYYARNLEREILLEYGKNLSLLSERVRTTFEELQRSVLLLQDIEEISTLLSRPVPVSDRDALLLNRGAEVLATFENTRTMIGDVWVYFREANYILTSGGTVDSELFFDSVHRPSEYPREFFQSLQYRVSASVSLYPPSGSSTRPAQSLRYLPLVFRGIGPAHARNLIVVDIDAAELERLFLSYLFTRNSGLLLASREGRVHAFAATAGGEPEQSFIDRVAGSVNWDGGIVRETIDGTLVIAQPMQVFKADYVLAAFVPRSEIAARTAAFRISVLAMVAGGLVVGLVLSVVLSRRLYAPLRDVVSLMQSHEETPETKAQNEYDYLRAQIDRLFTAERQLRRDLSQALPLAYERCLLQIARTGSNEYEEELRGFLREADNDFVHPGFCTVLVRYAYEAEYYKTFSTQAEVELQSTVAGLVGSRLPEPIRVYPVTVESHLQCIVLNLPLDTEPVDLKSQFLSVLDDVDLRFVRLSVSIGQILSGLAGIAESHVQARRTLSMMIHLDEEQVQLYDGEGHEGYSMPREVETRIENFLSVGEDAAALGELSAVVEDARGRVISEADMRLLYMLAYAIGRRVLEGAGGSVSSVDVASVRIPEEIANEVPLFDVHESVVRFYREVCEFVSNRQSRTDVQEIAQYIQENYHENIYLESIADHFGLSYKYLSHKIKDYLGIPFQHYLTNLRVSRAKELLTSSDKPVSTVAREVGYESTSTFYRVFKKSEGITAGEYRRARTKGGATA